MADKFTRLALTVPILTTLWCLVLGHEMQGEYDGYLTIGCPDGARRRKPSWPVPPVLTFACVSDGSA